MSADRQRLTSAIRRIAKTDPEIRGLLDAADNKGGKPGSAGVGSSTDAESQRICCDGSVSDNANPGVEERDPDADGAGQDGGLDGSDPALLDMGEGTLSGVTDCATGEPICFDGGGFIPPDRWDEPNDPPIIEGYNEGFFYVAACRISFVWKYDYGGGIFFSQSAAQTYIDENDPCDNNPDMAWECDCSNLNTSVCQNAISAHPDACSPTTEDLTLDAWPTDGCVNLAIINGTIVGSKYDPENDGSYSAPRDSIDLCSGTDQISLAPAANGGWKTINSTTNNGYLYDSSGKQIAHIDGNEYSDPAI